MVLIVRDMINYKVSRLIQPLKVSKIHTPALFKFIPHANKYPYKIRINKVIIYQNLKKPFITYQILNIIDCTSCPTNYIQTQTMSSTRQDKTGMYVFLKLSNFKKYTPLHI